MPPRPITTGEFDAKFDTGGDISEYLDISSARVFEPGDERASEPDSKGIHQES